MPNTATAAQARGWLRSALRDSVAPLLRSHGFRGSGQVWRYAAGDGSVVVVQVVASRWNSAPRFRYRLQADVVPQWWRAHRGIDRPPRVGDGICYRILGVPTPGADDWWEIDTAAAAETAAEAMADRLSVELSDLVRMLDPSVRSEAARGASGRWQFLSTATSADELPGTTVARPVVVPSRAALLERALARFPFLSAATGDRDLLTTQIGGSDPAASIRVGYRGGVDGPQVLAVSRFLVEVGGRAYATMADIEAEPGDRDLEIIEVGRPTSSAG